MNPCPTLNQNLLLRTDVSTKPHGPASIMNAFVGPNLCLIVFYNGDRIKRSKEQNLNGPYNRFLYALKAPEFQRQYPKRLEVFLNFIEIEGVPRPRKTI